MKYIMTKAILIFSVTVKNKESTITKRKLVSF
jgi:hypothetical protein